MGGKHDEAAPPARHIARHVDTRPLFRCRKRARPLMRACHRMAISFSTTWQAARLPRRTCPLPQRAPARGVGRVERRGPEGRSRVGVHHALGAEGIVPVGEPARASIDSTAGQTTATPARTASSTSPKGTATTLSSEGSSPTRGAAARTPRESSCTSSTTRSRASSKRAPRCWRKPITTLLPKKTSSISSRPSSNRQGAEKCYVELALDEIEPHLAKCRQLHIMKP